MAASAGGSRLPFLSRASTSVKLFFILTLALFPLGLIALMASLETSRTAGQQRRADLAVATNESSRKLGTELVSDMVVLAQTVRAANVDTTNTTSPDLCARPAAVFAARAGRPVAFAIFGAQPGPLCASPGARIERPVIDIFDGKPALKINGNSLDLIIPSPQSDVVAVARYPVATLASFAKPSGYTLPYRMQLYINYASLPLIESSDLPALATRETVSAAIGLSGATLEMTVANSDFGPAQALLTFLPLLMWASAALVGFFVVDRVLIRPLTWLRADVAAYVPGTPMALARGETPAVEIDELRQSFTDFADRLALREHDLEQALNNQVKLTREVHHRVKNNLQVIASLISLHARGASSDDVAAAYATIQRRVDALAIVHRNHFAELENHQGIDVRAMLSELSKNFRANATPGSAAPVIAVTAEPLIVGQDTAMPLAFLFTELAEVSMLVDGSAAIAVKAVAAADGVSATLSIQSPALAGDVVGQVPGTSYSMRIVDGLARQLRSPLDFDAISGAYSLRFPLMIPTEKK